MKNKPTKPTITIMCGLPRCGKSTWIKNNKGDAIIVSPDEIRCKILGHQFFKEAEGFVWAITGAMVRLLLNQGKSVIIDATNINYSSRGCWISLANEYKIETKIIWIKTSLDICQKRNAKSKEGQKVPPEVINRMAAIFQDPESDDIDNVTVIEVPKRKGNKKNIPFSNYYVKDMVKVKN